MNLLEDRRLKTLIAQGHLLTGLSDPDKQVKGCSVDLTIGEIYVPGCGEGTLGSVGSPRRELALLQGQTAVVRTTEALALLADQAGIAFPAATVSLKGLLMTNPGHVDPGYGGHLHVTVINMGKEPYVLRQGERLLRLLILQLEKNVERPFQPRPTGPIDDELLARLSHDFVNVEARAADAARRAVDNADSRARMLQIVIPVVTALLGIAGTWYATSEKTQDRLAQIEARIPDKIQERLSKAEALVPIVSRLDGLELQKLRDLDDRLKKVERTTINK